MKLLNPRINVDDFFKQLEKSKASLLIVDFDGTLAPFSINRMEVKIYPEVLPLIHQLIINPKVKVIIVSGRALEDLKVLLPFYQEVEVWGSHGVEHKNFKVKTHEEFFKNPNTYEILENIKKMCCCEVPEYCEIKPYGVALHWRGLNENEQRSLKERFFPEWENIIRNSDLEIHFFNGGMEVRPGGRNKGNAVLEIIKETSPDIPMAYLGDDSTDEQAFEALGDRGLSVLVNNRPQDSHADVQITPPHELRAFLNRWLNAFGGVDEH
jgi:trehalose-phosphatase